MEAISDAIPASGGRKTSKPSEALPAAVQPVKSVDYPPALPTQQALIATSPLSPESLPPNDLDLSNQTPGNDLGERVRERGASLRSPIAFMWITDSDANHPLHAFSDESGDDDYWDEHLLNAEAFDEVFANLDN